MLGAGARASAAARPARRTPPAPLLLPLPLLAGAAAAGCLGEFQACPASDCALDRSLCGACGAGEYRCPLGTGCAPGPDLGPCPLAETHFDSKLSLEARLDFLARQASLEEQISQLTSSAPAIPRLGIPAYTWTDDDSHGVRNDTHLSAATVFPDGCGLGATWDPDLLRRVARAIGEQARAVHNFHVARGARGGHNGWGITAYAPNVNLVRDPRWGRAQEAFGEDPLHAGRLGAAFVEGLQGPRAGPHLLAAATCKHFAAYDLERVSLRGQWRMGFDAAVGARDLLESYLPAFEACVGAGAEQVMCSYNSVNGVPACASPDLLNGVLRAGWGFNGSVVSDFDAWANLVEPDRFVENLTMAAAVGLNAGMDQEGGGTAASSKLRDAVAAGLTTRERVAASFKRLFRTRIRLGMFDPPASVSYNHLALEPLLVGGRELALRAARAAVCLYSNRGAVLPLRAPARVAVVGPGAVMGQLLLGNYMEPGARPEGIDRLLEGIARRAGEGRSFLEAVRRCEGAASVCDKLVGSSVTFAAGCRSVSCPDQTAFAEAEAAAAAADVTVVVLGLRYDAIEGCVNCTANDPPDTCATSGCESEGFDRITIELPPNQYALVRALRRRTSRPLVGVFVHGGAFALKNLGSDLDAMLDAWYPGEAAGEAVASILFGEHSPAGRSAVTWYSGDRDLPADRTNMSWYAARGYSYRFFQGSPDIPFGHGLSYTTFSYDAGFTNREVESCGTIGITITVRNTGAHDGDEVVQVYIVPVSPGAPQPQLRLAAFERISLGRGASKPLRFRLAPEARAVVAGGGRPYLEAGPLDLWVGGGQPGRAAGWRQRVLVRGPARPLGACDPGPVYV